MKSFLFTTRRGVSLIELLVVIAIITALAVTVIPNVTNTAEARRGREAARMVSSFIAKAHSRAIGRREPSGFMVTSTGSASFAAIDLFLADVPPPYRGDTEPALLTVSGSNESPSTRIATSTNAILLSGTAGARIERNDLIRFSNRGPWYELSADAVSGTSFSFRMRGDLTGNAKLTTETEAAGITQANTPWPPSTLPLSFEVLRKPTLTGSPLSLPDGRCVDLYWSGYGPPTVAGVVPVTYRRFTNAGSRTSIVFDGTGRLRQIVEATPTVAIRRAVTGAVFLLVGRLDRVPINPTGPNQPNLPTFDPADDSTGANWQYPDSWWVAIDPLTGMTKIAECKPGAATVEDSQQWIREALLASGR